jgi:T5SS/PEP-CTERM-associated repeat protein
LLNGNTLAVTYHNAVGSVGVYDLTKVPIAASAPLSFLTGGDLVTNDNYVIPTTYLTWTGTNGTDFGTASNWNFATIVPSAADFALFNNGVGGTISGTGAVQGFEFYNSGTWTLAPGTSLSAVGPTNFDIGAGGGGTQGLGALTIGGDSTISLAGAAVFVALHSGDSASLTVSGGGVLRHTVAETPPAYAMYVGFNGASGTLAASSGTVVVTGAGSLIDLGSSGLGIGNNANLGTVVGNGAFTVSQGGSVSVGTPNSNNNYSLAIGQYGNGTLTVEDPGSQVTAVGAAYIAHNETGTLIVENSGSFLAALDPLGLGGLTIGNGKTFDPAGGIGVGGTGNATVTSLGVLNSPGSIVVGSKGDTGELSVLNGGTVEVGTALTVGTGGTLINGVTETASGTVTIGAGGTVEVSGTAQTANYGVELGFSNIGTASTENAVATVSGTGALLKTIGHGLAVGEYGDASLTVSQGGSVATGITASSLIPALAIALAIGRQGTGTVTVTDPNTQLTIDGNADVGRAGTGSLIVENLGSVVMGLGGAEAGILSIGGEGTNTGGGGTLYVGGTGSALVTTGGSLSSLGNIEVGNNGATGTLSVTGATVSTVGQLQIGDSVTLSPGATLISPTGTTTVTAPTVETGTGAVTVGSSGILTVDQSGSSTAAIVLGDAAGSTGALNVTSGGTVSAGGGLSLFQNSTVSIGSGAGVTIGGTGTINAGATLTNDGTLTLLDGALTGAGSVINNGSVIVDPSTLTLASLSGTGEVLIGSGSTVTTQGTVSSGQTINFSFSKGDGELDLNIADFAGTIAATEPEDRFVVTAGTLSGLNVINGNTLTFSDSGPSAGAGGIDQIIFASSVSASDFAIVNSNTVQVACFAAGTRIETATGPVAVEDLAVGDRLVTPEASNSGDRTARVCQPIVWIGQRDVNCERHPRPETVWPVRVRAGAFSGNTPVRDLYLSPDHAVFLNGVLVPVKLLINHTSITQVKEKRFVTSTWNCPVTKSSSPRG